VTPPPTPLFCPRTPLAIQILSILEELHEQKAHQLKVKHKRSTSTAAPHGPGGHLQSVPEGGDDTIAAIRAAAAAADANGHHYPAAAAGVTSYYGSGATYGGGSAAAVAATRMAVGSNGQPVTYGSAVAAVSGGLEELLWADPWDTAALTQLLELLLQVGPHRVCQQRAADTPQMSC
jgi:hypothetical protein